MRNRIIILAALMALALTFDGCTKRGEMDEGAIVVRFSAHYANAPSAVIPEMEQVEQVRAYIVSEGVVKKVFVLDNLTDLIIEQKYHFADAKLYVVANDMACVALGSVVEGNAESVFEELILTGEIQKVPLYGVVDLSGKAGEEVKMQLERSMVRFDLVVDENRGIEVQSVNFEGLPTNGKLFSVGGNYSQRLKASRTPVTQTSVEGLLYSYELPLSAGGATASLDVRYNGNLATLVVPIDELKRNYIYNLMVHAYDGKLTATINSSTMIEGDPVTGGEVYTHTLIDETESTFEGTTKLISPTMVQLPNKNCEIILALSGNYDKTFTIEGDPAEFDITPVEGTKYENQKLKIKAAINSKYGYGGRAIILTVSHIERGETVSDRISVTQATPEPFAPVVMGGLEWFPFNALGQDMSLYPVVMEGQSVRDVLKANWYKYGGACYQWGPRKTYNTLAPWDVWAVQGGQFVTKNGPIIDLPADLIWPQATTPCPAGWRLPTAEECARIWAPHDKLLPVTYTNNGVEYTMTLEPTGLVTFIYVHGNKTLYNVVISDGVNELIFPAGGIRNESNTDAPGSIYGFGAKIGASFTLRTQKALDSNGNCAGIGLVRHFNNDAEPAQVLNVPKQTNTWTKAHTFCNVRCVRDMTR